MQIKLFIDAGDAKGGPPLGPILGQYQIDIVAFCKEFNEKTKNVIKGLPLPVIIEKYESVKGYRLIIKSPTINFLTKQFLVSSNVNEKVLLRKDVYTLYKILISFRKDLVPGTAVKLLFSSFGSMKIIVN
jgi:ribosomal protein L11